MTRPSDTGLAPENTRQKRRQGGGGRPFERANTQGRPFPAGQSGNPGGRPATEAGFRARCRELATDMLERLATAPAGEAAGLVRAFEAIADRGGYTSTDTDTRFILSFLALDRVSDDQRNKVLATWKEAHAEPSPVPAQTEETKP